MNALWDGGDIAFQPETWAAFGRIMYPGAFGMAFASSRGYHRMACAIEDGGFLIHPAIGWLQGQGFPKATRIDTRIDKEAGVEREVIGTGTNGMGRMNINNSTAGYRPNPYSDGIDGVPITAPATDLAKAWAGHRYGLQALKPALEFICVFQKPYEGRPLDNITQTGAGALNIDAGRIPGEPYTINTWDDNAHPFGDGAGNPYTSRQESGRWPANFILDSDAAEIVDRQSGNKTGAAAKASGPTAGKMGAHGIFGSANGEGFEDGSKSAFYGDSGGASRFFYQVEEQVDEADPIFYCPKASTSERNAGLDGLPENKVLIGAAGHKINPTTGKPVVDIPRKNVHPTVKSISLAKYLAGILLPPALYAPRRLFVPFCGVSSEMIGAYQAGWDEIIGVELKLDYAEIGRLRLDYWTGKPRQLSLLE